MFVNLGVGLCVSFGWLVYVVFKYGFCVLVDVLCVEEV